jgi:ribonuclease VapC
MIARAYEPWGRRLHPAGLNLATALHIKVAMEHSCRLLFVGDDFSKTDVGSVL